MTQSKPDGKPAQPDNPYKTWHKDRLAKEAAARGISVREDAEAHEYADALLKDDEAGGAKIREDNAPPQET